MSAVITSLARHPQSKPLAGLVNVVLLAALVWLLTRFLWLALDWNAPLPSGGGAAALAVPTAAPAPSLARWHLFGNAAQLLDTRVAANAPETSLAIDLRGVLSAEDPKQGRAFIGDAGGERSVFVGQEIASGVLLDAVYPDRITLSRGGSIEVLKLRSADGDAAATNTAAPTRAATAFGLPSASKPAVTASNAPIDRNQFGMVTAPNLPMVGVDMEAVKKQLGVDPAVLANQITPMPVMENGKFVGVRLNGGQHASVLAKLGLQPEDVVTAVNGVPVTDPGRIGPAISALSQASRIEVQVRRNGKSESLVVEIPR